MILGRGEVWLADLDPVRGSEQAGIRPVILFQNDLISKYSSTVISIPLTTNLNRLSLPSSVLIPSNESDLSKDSVVLCHQMRVLDRERLIKKISNINRKTLKSIEKAVLLTLGYWKKIMICALCGNDTARIRRIARTYGKGKDIFVIENVPVVTCSHCGESYLDAKTLHEIESIKHHRKSLEIKRSAPVVSFA